MLKEGAAPFDEAYPVAPDQLPVDDELTLVMTRESDAVEGYALVEANREHLGKYLGFAQNHTLEKAQANYRKAQEIIREGKLCNYFIVRNGEKVGVIGMDFPDDKRGVMGYWLIESAEHQGVATRCAQALLGYAFDERHLGVVELDIQPTNTGSQRLAARIGAHNTGRTQIEDGQEFEVWEVLRGEEH